MSTKFDGDSEIAAGLRRRDDDPVGIANDKISFRKRKSLRAIRLIATISRDKEIVSLYNRSIYYYIYTECMHDTQRRKKYSRVLHYHRHIPDTFATQPHETHDTHVLLLI